MNYELKNLLGAQQGFKNTLLLLNEGSYRGEVMDVMSQTKAFVQNLLKETNQQINKLMTEEVDGKSSGEVEATQ